MAAKNKSDAPTKSLGFYDFYVVLFNGFRQSPFFSLVWLSLFWASSNSDSWCAMRLDPDDLVLPFSQVNN